MQTKIHIFAHRRYLARHQGQTRVCGVKRIISEGFVQVCVGVKLLYERVKHTWGPGMIISVSIDTTNHSAYDVAKPVTVRCRSPAAVQETPGLPPPMPLCADDSHVSDPDGLMFLIASLYYIDGCTAFLPCGLGGFRQVVRVVYVCKWHFLFIFIKINISKSNGC